jgi:hypothetical protein
MTNQIPYPVVTSSDQTYPVQYIEETTYGALVTASPVYTPVKVAGDLTPKIDGLELPVRQAGSYTLYSSQSAGHDYGFTLNLSPTEIGIMKYGANGVANKDKSIQIPIVYEQAEAATSTATSTFYMYALGAKCNTLTLNTAGRTLVNATSEWICREWTKPSKVSGLTTPTFTTFGSYSDAVLSNIDSGNLPLTIGSTTYAVSNFSITWNNNLFPWSGVGSDEGMIEALKLGPIDITGTFTTPVGAGLSIETLAHDFPQTGVTASFRFKTGNMILSMTQFKIMGRDSPILAQPTAIRENTVPFMCSTAVLATT